MLQEVDTDHLTFQKNISSAHPHLNSTMESQKPISLEKHTERRRNSAVKACWPGRI